MQSPTSEYQNSHFTGFSQGQEDFRVLIDSIKDYGIFMMDPSGFIKSWNTGAEKIKGYRADEVIGKHFSIFYPEEDKAIGHPAKELQIASREGRYEEEGWRIKKDGSRFWANIIITRLLGEDGKIIGYSKITRDLTERKNSENALRESEERFRLMIESVKDYAILMLDSEGNVISWNEGAERIKGWKPKEIIGRHFSIFYPPQDVKNGKPENELKVAAREGRFEDLGWRMRKDGSRFFANVIITALKDDRGNIRGFSKVTRDITDKKNAEDEIKRAYNELEKRVLDRTHALTVANRELESFSYSVSHDLRAPLRSMDGFSQALLSKYGDQLDERGKDYLKRIRESSQRMGLLIEDILNLSKLGRSSITKSMVDVTAVARELCQKYQFEYQERFECVIAPGIRAFADESMLKIALDNLIQNSFKYTHKVEHPRIEIGVSTKQNKTVYFIQDNGAGFDMAFSDKLFIPFQRLHSEKDYPGTGIGLASVKRVISRHGGDIWMMGEVGKGATFYFTLEEEQN